MGGRTRRHLEAHKIVNLRRDQQREGSLFQSSKSWGTIPEAFLWHPHVYLYKWVCAFACMHICVQNTHMHAFPNMHVHSHAFTRAHTPHICTPTCVHVFTHTHRHVHIHVYTHKHKTKDKKCISINVTWTFLIELLTLLGILASLSQLQGFDSYLLWMLESNVPNVLYPMSKCS